MPTLSHPFASSILVALLALASACASAHGGGAPLSTGAPPRTTAVDASAKSSSAVAQPQGDAVRLSWMEGRWAGSADGIDMEEHWTSAAGGALIGMHKDVKGTRMTSFEFLRIESTPRDGLVYFASPRAAPATAFVLVELDDKRAVFENKAHDFPQRILYWLDAAGALHARVEGTLKGSPQAEEWTWTRK
jgi:hypothetical protein